MPVVTQHSVQSSTFAGLIMEYPMTELGQQAFNVVTNPSLTATVNLLGRPEQDFNATGGVWSASGAITNYFAANPIDSQVTATRWVASSGSPQFNRQNSTNFAAVQYTFSIYAKSNTGASQKIRIGYESGAGTTLSSDLTVTTSWQQFTFTSTPGSAVTAVYMPFNDVAQDALDILIYGPQMQTGAAASAYVPAAMDLQMGSFLVADAADPTRSATLGIDTSGGVTENAYGCNSSAFSLSEVSIYAVIKWTGGTVTYSTILVNSFSTLDLVLFAASNSNQPNFLFANHDFVAPGANLHDNQWHIFTAIYDGTRLRIFIDNMDLGSLTSAGLGPISFNKLFIGNIPDGGNNFPGKIGYLVVCNQGHSTSEILSNQATLQGRMLARGVVISDALASRYYIAEGDSITDYSNLGQGSYFYKTIIGTAATIEGQDLATSGATIPTVTSRLPIMASLYNANRKANIVSILLGANDLNGITTPAQFVTSYKTLLSSIRAIGYEVIVGTILPQKNPGSANPNFIADRNAANALMLADPDFTNGVCANGFFDIASDPAIGCDSCGNNVTYYPDGVHPSAACTTIIAPYVISAVEALY